MEFIVKIKQNILNPASLIKNPLFKLQKLHKVKKCLGPLVIAIQKSMEDSIGAISVIFDISCIIYRSLL